MPAPKQRLRQRIAGLDVLRNHWYSETCLKLAAVWRRRWCSAPATAGRQYRARRYRRAAAAALARDFAGKTTLTLSGAKADTTAEIAALVSEAAGKPIQVIPVPLEGLVQGMIGAGLPEPIARTYARSTRIPRPAASPSHRRFQGSHRGRPIPFEQWLAANKAALTVPAAA